MGLQATVERVPGAQVEIAFDAEGPALRRTGQTPDPMRDRVDDEIESHGLRVSRYAHLLATLAGLSPEQCRMIRLASRLHDAGSYELPHTLLGKGGRLTDAERREMELHTVRGHSILSRLEGPAYELAATIALTHHERIDGTGYPCRLKGLEIPLEGRITAIADVFDALTSPRPYRRPKPVDEAARIMRDGRGTQFDAQLVVLFVDDMERAWMA
jgi:HD-GYP domain-containing protein (c-di-GMP phosphodiesterase class II)